MSAKIFSGLFLFVILLSACAGAPATEAPPPFDNEPETQEAGIPPTSQEGSATPTFDIVLLFTPQASPTPLPPLATPSPIPNAPARLPWDGQPTYLGESQPGYLFRVEYDPTLWGLTEDDLGQPALAHRLINYCVISPHGGRGLPLNVVVEHESRRIGDYLFEINTAFSSGKKQFVTYSGGDGIITTGFLLNFEEDADACISDAEDVLITLTSVADSLATPPPTDAP
jgi:hypothetical protein